MGKDNLKGIGLQFFAEPDAEPENGTAPEGAGAEGAAPEEDAAAQLKKLQEELAREKRKSDDLAKENAEKKRQLRSLQTAEEQKAEAERERQEAIETELAQLRKQSAVAVVSKQVMSFVGDEAEAGLIAEALYGAEDADAALAGIKKAWAAREKRLRMEYGKIPAPGAGDAEPTLSKEEFQKMGYRERAKLAGEHPELYKKMTT